MKKTIRGLIALILTICIVYGMVSLANYAVVDDSSSYTRVMMHEFYEAQDITTVFIGTSHCFRAYDPALYEELTGEHTFNLGSSSQNLDTTYYLLKEAISRQPIEKVYLDVHYKFMFMDPNDRDTVQLNIISDYMRPSLNRYALITEASGWENFTNSVLPFRRDWERLGSIYELRAVLEAKSTSDYKTYAPVINETEHYAKNGFVWSDDTFDSVSFQWWDNYDDIDVTGDDTFGRTWLPKIAELCEKEQVELIFVSAPSNKRYLEEVGPYAPAHDYMQAWADEFGVPYYDFNYILPEKAVFEDADFMDVDHLNGAGAGKLTKLLCDVSADSAFVDEFFRTCYDE